MKKDFGAVLIICLLVFGIGYFFYNTGNSNAVKVSEDTNLLDNVSEANEVLNNESFEIERFWDDPETELKETNYTLDQVYAFIRNANNEDIVTIPSDMQDIIVNFYDYFDRDTYFINMDGEKYDYDEYTFIKKYHLLRNQVDTFGLYLISYSKCDVFSSVSNTERNYMLETYCS